VNIQPFFATSDFVQNKHYMYCLEIEEEMWREEKFILLTCLVKPFTEYGV